MIIVDANTKISEPFDADRLVEHMNGPLLVAGERTRIEKAFVLNRAGFMDKGPPQSPEDYDRHHDWLIRQVARHSDRLIPVVTFNPYFAQEHALDLMEKLVTGAGFKALKLHTYYHNFRVNDELKLLAPILERCAKLRIPLMIHTGDPFSEPSRMEPLAEAYREVNMVLLHFGTQTVSFAVDAIGVAKRNSNVYLESSQAPFARLKEGVRILGSDKIIFGSDAPVNDIWAQAMTVGGLQHKPPLGVGLGYDDLAKVMGINMMRLAGLG